VQRGLAGAVRRLFIFHQHAVPTGTVRRLFVFYQHAVPAGTVLRLFIFYQHGVPSGTKKTKQFVNDIQYKFVLIKTLFVIVDIEFNKPYFHQYQP
jgi:hypothetical protein